jgi:hypothetical protein
MNINLEQFVGKEVTVTLRDGKIIVGFLYRNSHPYPYKLFDDLGAKYTWNRRGWYFEFFNCPPTPYDKDIIEISEIVKIDKTMSTNKQQLLQAIGDTEQQLEKLKEQLNAQAPTIQNARVGDTLEDGSIVLKKENGLALVVAPIATEVSCQWSKDFPEVFDRLAGLGFIPSQWFVPTVGQLMLAYRVIPGEFSKEIYWSSSDYSASGAYLVFFDNGGQYKITKSDPSLVRAFRCVSY